jgi:branched-chain amino acid transport system substrate-binding protein
VIVYAWSATSSRLARRLLEVFIHRRDVGRFIRVQADDPEVATSLAFGWFDGFADRADHLGVKAFMLALTLFSSVLAAGCRGGETATPVEIATCSDLIYEGEGKPDAIIVSDLLRGQPTHGVRVVERVLRQRDFRAGDYRIGYQSCHSEIGERSCERNAMAYAAATDVLGMIGPYYSACAALQIPILSRTATGPLAMVSPTNTDPGLTRGTPFSDNDPDSLYTGGVRNYVRVVASDDDVGAAAAFLAHKMRARRVVALVNREAIGFTWYGPSLGAGFVETAHSLGLATTELEWRTQRSYASIARRAAAARPQLVFFAGHTENNARRLMEDLRRRLGPNVVFAAGDQFVAAPSLPKEWGAVGEGLRVTGYGVPPKGVAPAARRFLRSVGVPGEFYLLETAQAAEVLLDAVARSDGTRAAVVEELFSTSVTDGMLGSFSFDQYGDIVPATVTLYSIRNGAVVVDGVVRVPTRRDN